MNKQGKAIGDNQRNSMKMACEILFIFAEVSFCAFADSPPDVIEGGGAAKHSLAESVTGEHYLSRDGAQLDVSEGSLIIARDLYPEIDIPKYLYLIDEMVQELETRIHGNDDPHNLIQMINEYLFEEQGFQYEAGTHFLNKVLDDKRGSCVGLATLYIALTQRLDIPCCAVNIPQHVIVRFSDGNTRINLEMQHGGKILPDAWYIENWGIGADAIQTRAYLQELSKKEFLALIVNNRGNKHREAGKYLEAIRDFSLAIAFYPKFVEAYYSRGITYADIGRYDDAIKECNAALALDSQCPYAYANRGVAYSGKGDTENALKDYNKALAFDPKMAGVYSNRGILYSDKGDMQKAVDDYNNAIALDSTLAAAYFNRANLLRDIGELTLAIEDYRAAVQINPLLSDAYYNSGMAYMNLGDLNNAIVSFGKVIEVAPNHVEAYYNRGVMHAMTGNPKAAIDDCNRAIRLAPNSGNAYLMRAMVYGLKKDKNNALQDLEKALELDSELVVVCHRNEVFKDWWTDPDFIRLFQ